MIMGCAPASPPPSVVASPSPSLTVEVPANATVSPAASASASASAAASAAPAASPRPGSGGALEALGQDADSSDPSDSEVQLEATDLKQSYQELEDLRPPPGFVTRELIAKALPPGMSAAQRQEALDRDPLLMGQWLDPQHTLYLLRSQWGAVESDLVLTDAKGTMLAVEHFTERSRVILRDVVGDSTKEIVVQVTEGNALSTFPLVWKVLEAANRRSLRTIATVIKSHSSGSKSLSYCFLNRVTFPARDKMMVDTVLLDGWCRRDRRRPMPSRVGEHHEYSYSAAAGRFVESTAGRR